MGEFFWQKDSLITNILFELCLFRNLALYTFFTHPLRICFFLYISTLPVHLVLSVSQAGESRLFFYPRFLTTKKMFEFDLIVNVIVEK